MARKILLDTNLLVLLIVGSMSERLIATHKRTQAYDVDAFRLLSGIIGSPSALVTTSHILAETSNLIRQCADPYRRRLTAALQVLVHSIGERHCSAERAASSRHFQRLGLTDAALLEIASAEMSLLTDDLDLYLAAAAEGMTCENFSHLRAGRTS